MKPDLYYHRVQTAELSMTIIGGPLVPGDAGHVWITSPAGVLLFQVPMEAVTASSPKETAQRPDDDRRGLGAS